MYIDVYVLHYTLNGSEAFTDPGVCGIIEMPFGRKGLCITLPMLGMHVEVVVDYLVFAWACTHTVTYVTWYDF